MDYVNLNSHAKINLTLDVIGRNENGYHNLEMIMQTVDLHDTVVIRRFNKSSEQRGGELRLCCNLPWLPVDERNHAFKAASLIMERYGIDCGIEIDIRKRIPVSAGLGGGSSNAATVLIGMNKLFKLGLPLSELQQIGLTIGADVPFCLMRGTAFAEGIGERLTKLPACPSCYVVIAKPPISISTANVFKAFDMSRVTRRPDSAAMRNAIAANDIDAVANNMVNVLESVTAEQYHVIYEIKEVLIQCGALGAVMSGSGPSTYGLFLSRRDAVRASRYLKLSDKARDVFVSSI